jgi:hypothetical protein
MAVCGDTAGALQLLNYADETLSLKDFLVVKNKSFRDEEQL